MVERLHPQSMHELRRLIQLHGVDRVRGAVDEIERKSDVGPTRWPLNDVEADKRGRMLAAVLMLRAKPNGRYNTTWGDKTPLGLFKTVERILIEGRDDDTFLDRWTNVPK